MEDASEDRTRRTSVLVIDDHAEMLEWARLVVEGHGYEVRVADNVREAFDMLRARLPDVVVTDIEMPGLDGFDVRRVLARYAPAIPVVAMTGSADAQVLTRVHGSGFWRVLLKPYSESLLIDAISAVPAPRSGEPRRRPPLL